MNRRVNRKKASPSAELELPPSLQAAWGIRARAEKGPKPGLNLAQIVNAAIHVAAAKGLAAVSMSEVSEQLGIGTMSLYRYVRSKDELLALMVDAVFAEPPAASLTTTVAREDWRASLSRWAQAHLQVLRGHPWAVRIPISGPPVLPNQVLWFERGIDCMSQTRLAERDKVGVLLLINGFVRNQALFESDLIMAARNARTSAAAAAASYGKFLLRLIDRQRFPALMRLIEAGVFEAADETDADFEFGLARILDGVSALLVAPRRR